MPLTTAAFAVEFPAARVWNLLDRDRLARRRRRRSCDQSAAQPDGQPHRTRSDGGADAILMACSMYGAQGLADSLWSTPVFTSDGDMMDAIAVAHPRRVAVLASLHGSATDSQARLSAHLSDSEDPSEVVGVFCAGAAAAAAASDQGGLVKALADGMRSAEGTFDALCIAQYSLSPVHDELADLTGIPVFSPPRFAAAAIRSRLGTS